MAEPNLSDFDKLWDYNDPAATERKFRAVLDETDASADQAYRAELLTQIARTQGLQRKFNEANATLDTVQRMLEGADWPLVRVRYLLERGRVLNSSGQKEAARPLFEDAAALATRHGLDAYGVDAMHMVAIVESDPPRQLEWNLRAMNLAESSSDERARNWRASLYNNIGWTYFDSKQYDKAMEVFEKAVVLRQERNQPRELRIARYCVAKTLRMQGKLTEAAALNRQLIHEAEQANEPDGYFYEELAECLLVCGDANDAKPYFRKAYDHLSKDEWLVEQDPARLKRLRELGE
jgi:tetratricopeptide (TPR) repeat protein